MKHCGVAWYGFQFQLCQWISDQVLISYLDEGLFDLLHIGSDIQNAGHLRKSTCCLIYRISATHQRYYWNVSAHRIDSLLEHKITNQTISWTKVWTWTWPSCSPIMWRCGVQNIWRAAFSRRPITSELKGTLGLTLSGSGDVCVQYVASVVLFVFHLIHSHGVVCILTMTLIRKVCVVGLF